jgi:hypothetical protein
LEQISTWICALVLRVWNLFPHPQVTVASLYSGWMPFFIGHLSVEQSPSLPTLEYSAAKVGEAKKNSARGREAAS